MYLQPNNPNDSDAMENNEHLMEEREPLSGRPVPAGAPKLTVTEADEPPRTGSMSSRGSSRLPMFLQYPAGVYFILGNEFCERFSFYGMRSILTMYLVEEYDFNDAHAKSVFHTFVGVAYLSPLIGSVLADDYLGRFRVILFVSIAYVFGHLFLTIGGLPYLPLLWRKLIDFSGLAVVALATGGIKPCVSAFAADQFTPTQRRHREQFFSFFYFAINAGALLSVLITPMLKQLECLGSHHCYPLAFGVPGALMLLALVLFLCGSPFYKRQPPNQGPPQPGADSWIDHAARRYDQKLVDGVRSLLNIIVLFCPVIVFWALFDQQGSTWVLQASRMDNRVAGLVVAPESMAAWNAVFILMLVPFIETFVYPVLHKLIAVTALRKMSFGCVVAASSFVAAALLQVQIDASMPTSIQPGLANVFVLNRANKDLILFGNHSIKNGESRYLFNVEPKSLQHINPLMSKKYELKKQCDSPIEPHLINLLVIDNQACSARQFKNDKMIGSKLRVYVYVTDPDNQVDIVYAGTQESVHQKQNIDCHYHNMSENLQCYEIASRNFQFQVIAFKSDAANSCVNSSACQAAVQRTTPIDAAPGGVHFVYMDAHNGQLKHQLLIQPNDVSILWQVPQLFLITVAEVLISITGLEFSYSQAALHMKSVLQAVWLMTVSCGNLLASGISASAAIGNPVWELVFYSALMSAVMLVFIVLAHRYKYVEPMESALLDIPGGKPEHKRSLVEINSENC